MLKNKTKLITILFMVFLLITTSFVFADEEDVTENAENSETTESPIILDETNFKSGDVYLTSFPNTDQEIVVDYIIDGNLFVMADTVRIKSSIGGDAFILAKNLIVEDSAKISNNLFAVAETFNFSGEVYDIYSTCNNIVINNGIVYRDIKVACNSITINGTISRNAYLSCNNISFTGNGTIHGNLEYSAKEDLQISKEFVNGQIKFEQFKEYNTSNVIADYLYSLGIFLSTLLIIWLICLWLAPKFIENTNKFVGKKTFIALGVGLLTPLAVAAAFIVLILLQLTSTIAFLLLALCMLAFVVSVSLFTITTNKFICTKLNIDKNLGIFGMLILTGIVLWGLMQIPYVGSCIGFLATFIGLGILVLSIFSKKEEAVKE